MHAIIAKKTDGRAWSLVYWMARPVFTQCVEETDKGVKKQKASVQTTKAFFVAGTGLEPATFGL